MGDKIDKTDKMIVQVGGVIFGALVFMYGIEWLFSAIYRAFTF